jgi:hypothetical protein
MWTRDGEISRLATIQANFKEPKPELIAEDKSSGENRDAAASIDSKFMIAYKGAVNDPDMLKPYSAGSSFTQLTNGLYAARYAKAFGGQGEGFPGNRFEVPPVDEPFWFQGVEVHHWVAREGVRLFDKAGRISATLGAENEGEPCYMGYGAVALAAGANEMMFALVGPNPEDGNKGDEVVELGPDSDAATRCSSDSRSVEVNGTVTSAVTVAVGAKIPFAVDLSNPAADSPFEFEWNFGDESAPEVKGMEKATNYKWPEPLAEHKYETPGIYNAKVRIYGAFGTSEVPVEVTVSPATSPVAGFSSPGGAAEEAVKFETTGSSAPPGTHIERYEWEFGDGEQSSTPNTPETHKYAKPGTYTVMLKVYVLGRTSEAVSHQVVISESAAEKAEREARELKEREEHEAQVKAAEAQAKAAAEAKARAEAEAAQAKAAAEAKARAEAEAAAKKKLEEEQARRRSSVKPPTRAQLLARALTACRKLKPAKKRASCTKAAQKRYRPPNKGKHKGGKKK